MVSPAEFNPEANEAASQSLLMPEANRMASQVLLLLETDGAAVHVLFRREADDTASQILLLPDGTATPAELPPEAYEVAAPQLLWKKSTCWTMPTLGPCVLFGHFTQEGWTARGIV